MPSPAWTSPGPDDTMLMFVGEDLDVLTIASRREESASQAPAVAKVISREELKSNGSFTLSEALSRTPGFYMAPQEWGTRPYLRGIPDSVLFLYDTVPLLSDMTKSVHPLDEELSLAPVKRIEIIRGPGSVLWGPDAFAGIVNVVPLTGRDLNGAEIGAYYGSPGSARGFHVNAGHDAGLWDAFMSVSGRETAADDRVGNVAAFWGDNDDMPVPPQERYGMVRADRPQFLEFNANMNYRDWISVTGRYSDFTRPYSIAGSDDDLIWLESRSAPVNFIKIEGKKRINPDSALRMTGYYSQIESAYEVIDLEFSPKEYTFYGETIYDLEMWSGKGLFTAGLAGRRKRITDAPVWDSFLPDYLGEDNQTFLPGITEQDYRTDLMSLFSQYTHKIGRVDLLAGVRYDDHDPYESRVSYNTGAVWSPGAAWTVKALYGTAYRTPFSSQLIEEEEPDLEKISTFNLKIAFSPTDRAGISLCGFINDISRHIMEDPYAGLSIPNHQKIKGVELEGWLIPMETVELSANLTALDNNGPDETYHYNDYSFIRPDGTVEKHYTDLFYPFDTGPETLANLMGKWTPRQNLSFFTRAGYFSSQQIICPRCTTFESISSAWLVDMSMTAANLLDAGIDLNLFVYNVLGRDYRVPGIYSAVEGRPFSILVQLTLPW